MNTVRPDPLDLWMKRVLTATMLALMVTLIAVGIVLYGPGTRAHAFAEQARPLATQGDDR
jgi:hypothetical protein